MLKNYLKIAVRNMMKNKTFSFVNIFGLAMGLGCFILVMVYVSKENSYDKFHSKADQIFRVVVSADIADMDWRMVVTPAILAPTLMADYPEIIEVTRIRKKSKEVIRYQDKSFQEETIFAGEPGFFGVFDFPLIQGNEHTALKEPYSVVISEDASQKYFGSEMGLNKVLTIGENDYKVTGIVKNVPENSHFDFDFLLSLESFKSFKSTHWFNNSYGTYLVLKKGFDYKDLQQKMPGFVTKHLYKGKGDHGRWEYNLQPLTSIHLQSHLRGEFKTNGNKIYVVVFNIIGFMVLLIAGINYINLSTARSLKRAKEIGVRKVCGSGKSRLMGQLLIESILNSLAALLIAIVLVEFALRIFSGIMGGLEISYFKNIWIIPVLISLGLGVGFFSGFYPAFYLSSLKPVRVLKGKVMEGKKNSLLRNGLVVFQFGISIILIAGTLIISNQMNYIKNKDLGFDKEQVIMVHNAGLIRDRLGAFKENLLSFPEVISAAGSYQMMGKRITNWGIKPEGLPADSIDFMVCDEDFQKAMGIKLVKGRFFSASILSDKNAVLLNEQAVKEYGWENPLGKKIKLWGDEPLTVIGVVKNFHYKSLHVKISRMGMLKLGHRNDLKAKFLSVRVKPENLKATLDKIKGSWESFSPPIPLQYSFLDQDFERLYNQDQRLSRLIIVFSSLAILISALGLFSLISYYAELRTKEIGVRKVLGASVKQMIMLLSGQLIRLVALANLIAWPIVYLAMNNWLKNFSYRIEIKIWMFLLSGVIALCSALFTISFQTFKAARANPVESLKYE